MKKLNNKGLGMGMFLAFICIFFLFLFIIWSIAFYAGVEKGSPKSRYIIESGKIYSNEDKKV